MASAPMTLVETGEFLAQAKAPMSDGERAELVAFRIWRKVEITPGTGGVRRSGGLAGELASGEDIGGSI